jgi:integrase
VRRYDERKVEFYFEAEELGRILEAADKYVEGSRGKYVRGGGVGLAIRMLATTGARASEVLKSHWGQFTELPDGRLGWTVESTNTKIGRAIPRALDADLSKRLLEWKPLSLSISAKPSVVRLGGPRWVFPQTANPQLPVYRIEKAWRSIKTSAGITRKEALAGRIHDLRHTAATLMLRGGASLTAVQHQLGHATPITTNRYVHIMPAGMVESGDLLGAISAKAAEAARSKRSAELLTLNPSPAK